MPSRVIHLAVAECLLRQIPAFPCDPDRFRLGSVLPDCAPNRAGHPEIRFADPAAGRTKKTYDLTGFRARFGEKLPADGLYLGYYLHLVGDIVQRKMLYGETGYDPHVPGNVARLHRDYELLNPYMIEKYALKAPPPLPAGIEEEELFSLAPFFASEFLTDMLRDFEMPPVPETEESCRFFSPAMADEFVRRAVLASQREILALGGGGTPLDEFAEAWESGSPSPRR